MDNNNNSFGSGHQMPLDTRAGAAESPVRKILLIKLRAIGDVLLSTVVLENLRDAFPTARIHFLTEPASAPILADNRFIDEVRVFDRQSTRNARFLFQLRKERYDLVIDLFCNPRSAFMTRVTGAPIRAGFPFRGRGYAYTIHIPLRTDVIHNTEFNLDALRRLHIPITSSRVHFPLKQWAEVDQFMIPLQNGRPIIALNPSGTWTTKRWGLSQFSKLGDSLIERYDAHIILLWGPGERPDAEAISRAMRREAVIAPPTTIPQLGALLQQTDFMITNDSGPMHIAAAVGTPVLGIFGPTNPLAQGPFSARSATVRREDLDCIGCNRTRCPIGIICMTNLAVETVLESFEELRERLTHEEVT